MLAYISVIAISLSLDAFSVGISYGMRKIRIPLISKMIICFFSAAYALIALIIGRSLHSILPANAAGIIGIAILIIMGIWITLQALFQNDGKDKKSLPDSKQNRTLFELAIKSLGVTIYVIKNPARGDIDSSGSIDILESLLLGLALSIDALGVGIGSALAGLHSILIPLTVGLFQLIFLYIGTHIGKRLTVLRAANRKALALLPGLLLIFLAVLRLV
jgi:putative sporulation protein YtaF